MKSRVINLIVVLIIVLIALTGCDKNNSNNSVSTTSSSEVKNEQVETKNEETENKSNLRKVDLIDYHAAAEKQFANPEKGEEIAIIKVEGYGDITVKFFKDKAPKAVENFLTHAKEGYYNGVKFHRVMKDFMIQSGDPECTGIGGESICGEGFEEELDYELVPYRGALCMASAGKGNKSLGSQFYIVQASVLDSEKNSFAQLNYPEKLIQEYNNRGGYLSSLYLNYTVFGQVIDGMDVVDKIANTEVTESSTGEMSVPTKDIKIKTIEVKEY